MHLCLTPEELAHFLASKYAVSLICFIPPNFQGKGQKGDSGQLHVIHDRTIPINKNFTWERWGTREVRFQR